MWEMIVCCGGCSGVWPRAGCVGHWDSSEGDNSPSQVVQDEQFVCRHSAVCCLQVEHLTAVTARRHQVSFCFLLAVIVAAAVTGATSSPCIVLIWRPRWGGSRRAVMFILGMGKLEWLGYNLVKVAWWSTQLFRHNTSMCYESPSPLWPTWFLACAEFLELSTDIFENLNITLIAGVIRQWSMMNDKTTAEYDNYIPVSREILTGKQGKGVYNIVWNRECHQKHVASSRCRRADTSWQLHSRWPRRYWLLAAVNNVQRQSS